MRSSVDETFLEMGGDSLTAAVIAADVHDQFGAQLGLDEFGEALTVKKMASLIDATSRPIADVRPGWRGSTTP